jgi:hypothetical protein
MKIRWLPVLLLIGIAPSIAQQGGGNGDVIQRLHRDVDTKGPLPVLRAGRWGYIDRSGATTISPQFEEAAFFYDGRAAVRLNGLWGYVDAAGGLAIPPRFLSATRFSDGLAHVRWREASAETTTSAYIDTTGHILVPCEAGDADVRLTAARCGRPFSGGFVAEAIEVFRCVDEPGNPKEYPCKAVLIDRWGYYDKSGRLAIAGPFRSGVSRFAEGLAAVEPYGEKAMGFIDASGSFVIGPRYERAAAFQEGLAAVRIGGLWGFVDRTGRFVVEPRFQSVSDFSQGFAAASLNGTWGYIDPTGQFAIVPRFQEAATFSEGLAAVCCDGGRTRYIDTAGRWAFRATFAPGLSGAGAFIEGIAVVEIAGVGPAYIDRTGRVVAAVRTRD